MWNKILGAPGYAPVVVILQGLVGCSSVGSTRHERETEVFARYMVDSDNGMMSRMWVRVKGADGGCT